LSPIERKCSGFYHWPAGKPVLQRKADIPVGKDAPAFIGISISVRLRRVYSTFNIPDHDEKSAIIALPTLGGLFINTGNYECVPTR
jgi:hypothetical protein